MKNLWLCAFLALALIPSFTIEAAADYALLCHHDLPGPAEKRRDKVVVTGANTLPQACRAVRDDPSYGDYNWRACVAEDGSGPCANPDGSITSGGGTTGTPPTPTTTPTGPVPRPPIGLPPSPPIGPVSTEPNVDRPGYDYATVPLAQPDVRLCSSMCENDRRCTAYTYVHPGVQAATAMCWLKSQLPPPVSNTCCVSGHR